MKKSSFLFLLSFCFALPAFAAQNTTTQTTQTVKTIDTVPAQVNVTINNTTSAQGNTQTTKVENTPAQPAAITASASAINPDASQNVKAGSTSLFGDYASSPYQSNVQVEMLRNTVWDTLVPRKRLYDDPATGNSSTRYIGSSGSSGSKYTGRQSSKKKSVNKQASGRQKTNTKTPGAPAAGTQTANSAAAVQNLLANLASGQIITLVQKDGLLCIPVDQSGQVKGQAFVPNISGLNTSDLNAPAFYVPASPSPVPAVSSNAGASPVNPANQNMSASADKPAMPSIGAMPAAAAAGGTNSASPAAPFTTSAVGANSASSAAVPATSGANSSISANSAGAGSVNTGIMPAAGTSGTNPAAAPAGSAAQSVNPASSPANTPDSGRDIFAVSANPFEPTGSSRSPLSGTARNVSGQSPSGNNSSGQNAFVPPVPAGGMQNAGTQSSGRNISITPDNPGTPNL